MNKSHQRLSRKIQKAFTLVELLVVIAIIAILASLLMPGLKEVRERGRQLGCMNNLRQFYLASSMYSDENNDRIVWISSYAPDYYHWMSYLALKGYGYPKSLTATVGNVKPYMCPSTIWSDPEYYYNWGFNRRTSYGDNTIIKYRNDVNNRAACMFMADSCNATTGTGTYSGAACVYEPEITTASIGHVDFRHIKKANILYFDGHIAPKGTADIPSGTDVFWMGK